VYRPHHTILEELNRARRSVKLCLFLIDELLGDHNDSVVDALINARNRGVDVQILFNGPVAHNGRIGVERLMHEELNHPLLPAVQRFKSAGLRVGLVYGQTEHKVAYSPIHSKYCVIDDYIVLEGSFNWYNTSVFSHDLLLVAANHDVARAYLHEFDQIQRLFKIYG
jgi:phosphatidylserine/phosphatidylglycerophosphate/cardiolipin synthase-like enzyme